jgi:hypothetical protein
MLLKRKLNDRVVISPLWSVHTRDWWRAVTSLSASLLQKISAAMDHLRQITLKWKFEKWCKFSICIKVKLCSTRPACICWWFMWKFKAVEFAVGLDLVFDWTPCNQCSNVWNVLQGFGSLTMLKVWCSSTFFCRLNSILSLPLPLAQVRISCMWVNIGLARQLWAYVNVYCPTRSYAGL